VAPIQDGLRATFEYATDLFDRDRIERMAANFTALLEAIVADPSRRLSHLDAAGGAALDLESPAPGQGTEPGHGAAGPARSPSTRARLIAIQPAGARLPLFCLPPLSGLVMCYRSLSLELGPEQPLFGLEGIGLDGAEEPLDRIEPIAARYAAAVRERQTRGPYALAGWSFGGLVALELAQELRRGGEETHLLVMDASLPGPASSEPFEDEETVALRILVSAFEERVGAGRGTGQAALRSLPLGADRLAVLMEQARQLDLPPDIGVEQARPVLRVMAAHVRARRAYLPTSYPGRVALLRTPEPNRLWPGDPTLGWRTIATGGVEVGEVPGPHRRLLDPPGLTAVADHVRSWLRRIAAGDAARGEPHRPGP
jgi:thioesterase domain-containing protein